MRARETLFGLWLLSMAMLVGSCDGDDTAGIPADDDTSPDETITGIDNLPGGNPLVPDVAMYPFPSDFYLAEDASTVTGRRVELSAEAMPTGLSAETFADADGFSRVTPILTWLEGGVDPSSLPDLSDPSAAQADEATVWVVREQTWERVPLLVEMDATAEHIDQQALIIRPQDALDPNTGYVVLLRSGLISSDGMSHPIPTDAFRALRDDIPTDCPEVEAQRIDFELVNEAIAATGLVPDEVVLAWSFHTRSEEQVVDPLLAMHDVAMTWPLDGWSIDQDEWDEDGENRLIEGTFTAPDFLGPDEWLQVDAQGQPVQQGTRDVPFMLTVPITASDQTRPVIVFGHGFFSAMEEPTWSSLNRGLQAWEMAAATTEFIGFCEDDLFESLAVIAEMDRLWVVISQQLQSHTHFTLLARLLSEELSSVVVGDSGGPLFDGDAVHYMGISNGGTQGLVIMTASPVFERGVLVVPGGAWTHMIQRAVQWNEMGLVLAEKYDDTRDLQLALGLMQLMFDPVDSLNWVEHLARDRFPGRPDVRVTLHEAVGDCQVSNMVTEWVARAGDIPLVTPATRDVWGLDTVTADPPEGADTNAALLIYDEGYPPLPEGNEAPAEDNDAHGTIRDLPAYYEQVGTFLETGAIVQVCDGACDPD